MLGYRMVPPLSNSSNPCCLRPFIYSCMYALIQLVHSWTCVETYSTWQCAGSEDREWGYQVEQDWDQAFQKLTMEGGGQNAHNSVTYKADGGQHYDKCLNSVNGLMEEGDINSDWRVGWRRLHQRSNNELPKEMNEPALVREPESKCLAQSP